MMKYQYFGTVETADNGPANAMLCIDADCPDEAMIQWWGENTKPGGALVRFRWSSDQLLTMEPIVLYRVNERGCLWLPQLTQDEFEHFKGFSAELKKNKDSFEGEWIHRSGAHGRVAFEAPSYSDEASSQKCSDWNEFKEWSRRARQDSNAIAFRGHGNSSYRLKTTLHRAGRHRLERYCSDELLQFKDHAEAVLDLRFNMEDGTDYATVLGLAQHYGLPTPLLDWTSSPYIAAFFAFSNAIETLEARRDSKYVRVYGLTHEFVRRSSPANVIVPFVSPYVSSLKIAPRNNPRLYAQQGQFLVTNVADVEAFIRKMEHTDKLQYLISADVPIECAPEALEDLAFMGLTAAAMFPGLDGVCRRIKHSMSFRRRATPPISKPRSEIPL